MKTKLKNVLLIDDDDVANFIHEVVLNNTQCAEKVVTVNSGEEGLRYIRSNIENKRQNPEIIFLDINMPKMNGWQFLEEYKGLDEQEKSKMKVIMLTSSINPTDTEKARHYEDVKGYNIKSMDEETLGRTLMAHFPEYF